MTDARDHIRQMIATADAMPALDLMRLHSIELERIRAAHAVDSGLWEQERGIMQERIAVMRSTVSIGQQAIATWRGAYFLALLFGACCLAWAVSK